MGIALAFLTIATGRGESPDEGIGVGIIIGCIVLVALTLAALGLFMRRRSQRDEREGGPPDEPHPPGRVGA